METVSMLIKDIFFQKGGVSYRSQPIIANILYAIILYKT